ncbi:class III lanthionine synthetase LanKC [Amycolatopsis jejuensis]|uniref:class III lanthionine synthetase LanKC n=1 Tax=Amycolatopsis jejuensis TaxID=330084 RepID=UPI00068D6B28|nr:class III lanthionine synthetase LanKC [Amycolatopsis jejuensis]
MKPLAELYTLADPVFFEDPVHWREGREEFAPDVPAGWIRGGTDGWVMLTPPGAALPEQGWKIHVSATPESSRAIVDTVAEYCFAHSIAFKFLVNPSLVRAFSLKYAPRASSGKVLALYPRDESDLQTCLTDLDAALAGAEGPYILSDLRYREGPLYVRYGGFTPMYCTKPDGERVLATRSPDGRLVPDERRPVFTMPDWVQLPVFLAESFAARGQAGDGFDYRVTEALHFSNGGGVYVATRGSDGREVVLKEARPYAGLSGGGTDAVGRMEQEIKALRRLDGVPGVPRVHDVFSVAGHRFLAMDRVPGVTLQQWLALNFPLVGTSATAADRRRYVERALAVLERIGALVEQVHERGIVFADLHPANILVDEDGTVGLVDFEAAFDETESRQQKMGYAGFTAGAKLGRAIDRHALAVLRLWMFLPLTSLAALAPGKLGELAETAERLFELPGGFAASIEAETAGTGPARPSPVTAGAALNWPDALGSMADAIRRSATPERSDRLFPGDIEVFRSGGDTFAYGAAGVLWALTVAGFEVEPAHERWLLDRAAKPVARPGFCDGAHGVAHVLDLLGHRAAAGELVERAAGMVDELTDVTLFSGLAGVGLNLLHLAEKRAEYDDLTTALRLAERVEAAIGDGEPHGIDKPPGALGRARDAGTHAGLLRGWSGPALFLLRLYESTGDKYWLDGAVRAVHRDLDLCVPAGETLQVDGGFRTLPYLEVGSVGIALVADELAGHVADERILESLAPLSRAGQSVFVADANLFHGRAGLLAVLARLSRGASGIIEAEQVKTHLGNLGWHSLAFHGHVSFPGDGCSRLSMDFATGNAGVLAALASVHDPRIPFLPFLSPVSGVPAGGRAAAAGACFAAGEPDGNPVKM